jgi:phosphoribosylglycinamide formyltransferase 2
MSTIGTPFSSSATKIQFCGSGELGKEVVIELQRISCNIWVLTRMSYLYKFFVCSLRVRHKSIT